MLMLPVANAALPLCWSKQSQWYQLSLMVEGSGELLRAVLLEAVARSSGVPFQLLREGGHAFETTHWVLLKADQSLIRKVLVSKTCMQWGQEEASSLCNRTQVLVVGFNFLTMTEEGNMNRKVASVRMVEPILVGQKKKSSVTVSNE